MPDLEASFSWGLCCIRCHKQRPASKATKVQELMGRKVFTFVAPCPSCLSHGAYIALGPVKVSFEGYVEPTAEELANPAEPWKRP